MSEESEKPHEIIIVKRARSHGHDDHHGGVWKIAFADFMTAMMAFFLVLWIVNSTSKETQAAIARYFNPVKITDTTPARKGLQDPRNTDFDATLDEPSKKVPDKPVETPDTPLPPSDVQGKSVVGEVNSGKSPVPPRPSGVKPVTPVGAPPEISPVIDEANFEMRIFDSPAAVLAEIVARAIAEDARRKVVEGVDKREGHTTIFQDPFAPSVPGVSAAQVEDAVRGSEARSGGASARAKAASSALGDIASEIASARAASAAEQLLADVQKEIAASIAEKKLAPADLPEVKAASTPEGVLITLNDTKSFSMFGVGSSVPNARAIAAIEGVASALATRPGQVVVRGHTDARAFRSGASDNWRLSLSRAQVAHLILRRGGLDDKRVEKLEALADRAPQNAADPLAAENRRIEILLRPPGSRT